MNAIDQSHALSQHLSAYIARLFAAPSFFEGLSRLVDFPATFNIYNEDMTPEAADLLAMRSDWQAVGADIAHALHTYGQHSPQASPSTLGS